MLIGVDTGFFFALEELHPTADSLILSALLEAKCKEIYTRDPHFELYKKKEIKIINLNKS